jgi:hypothetical protein
MVVGMAAAALGLDQPLVQIGGHQGFHRSARLAGLHLDAVLGKDGKGALADAADNDNSHALFAQPGRKQTRLVWGRFDHV